MEGAPKTTNPEKESELGSKIVEEIAGIQRGRELNLLSVQELKAVKEKYIKLKQELGVGSKKTSEGMETSYEQAQEIRQCTLPALLLKQSPSPKDNRAIL